MVFMLEQPLSINFPEANRQSEIEVAGDIVFDNDTPH